jgi:hypothetical protein
MREQRGLLGEPCSTPTSSSYNSASTFWAATDGPPQSKQMSASRYDDKHLEQLQHHIRRHCLACRASIRPLQVTLHTKCHKQADKQVSQQFNGSRTGGANITWGPCTSCKHAHAMQGSNCHLQLPLPLSTCCLCDHDQCTVFPAASISDNMHEAHNVSAVGCTPHSSAALSAAHKAVLECSERAVIAGYSVVMTKCCVQGTMSALNPGQTRANTGLATASHAVARPACRLACQPERRRTPHMLQHVCRLIHLQHVCVAYKHAGRSNR